MKYFRLFLFLLLASCSGSDNDAPDPVRTEQDVRDDFQNLTISEGINDFTLESNNETIFWDFRIIAPSGASSSNKRPLIVSLHGNASVKSDVAYKSTACLVEPGFENLNAYVISPSSNGYLWFDLINQNQVIALVDLAGNYLHVDKSKIVVTGYSDGGNGSWFFAQFYSNFFSASIPLASAYKPINSSGVVQKITIPMYVIHGSEDTLFPVEETQSFVEASNNEGSDIIFVVADGLSHFEPCNYVPFLKDASTWLTTDVW